MKKSLITLALIILGIITNQSLKAQITIGEVQPCNNPYLSQCPWNGPRVMSIPIYDCQDDPQCYLLVEHYIKDCGNGKFAIQIVRIYVHKCDSPFLTLQCIQCMGNLSNRYNECLAKLFKEYDNDYKPQDFDYIIQQSACTKTTNFNQYTNPSYIYPTLTIPISAIVNYDPIKFPENPLNLGYTDVSISCYSGFCSSQCCCFELVDTWDILTHKLLTLYTGDACGDNSYYECPTGCSGDCNDFLFSWAASANDMIYGKRGTQPNENDENIQIIPNPNNGKFTFTITDKIIGDLNIKLAEINGSVIKSFRFNKKINEFSQEIDINQPSGSYIIIVELNGVYYGFQKINIIK